MLSDIDVINSAIREDNQHKHAAGIYWYGAQEGKLILRDKKNFAVSTLYNLVSMVLNAFAGNGGNYGLPPSFITSVTYTPAVIGLSPCNIAISSTPDNGNNNTSMGIWAGTDTTTPTTYGTNALTSPVSNYYPVTSISVNATGYIQIVGTYPIGGLSSNPTIVIGEIGIFNAVGTTRTLLTRIAAGDGVPQLPVTINNTAAATFTAIIYL